LRRAHQRLQRGRGGRFHITLTGVCRFTIRAEIPTLRGYRRVVPDWERYKSDLAGADETIVDRPRLFTALKALFALNGVSADWESMTATPDEPLVTSLAMICQFAPSEKQALLEAPGLAERSPGGSRHWSRWRSRPAGIGRSGAALSGRSGTLLPARITAGPGGQQEARKSEWT